MNNFVFNCTHYLQTIGFAMGTICAICTNFEEKHIYPYIEDTSLLYFRYIEDIFMIWKSTEVELLTFIKDLNEKYKTIKLTFKFQQKKLHFFTQC